MAEPFLLVSPGDLEAVILAESFDLLGSVIGPSMYRVSGKSGQQQAMFASAEVHALFYIRVHEFLADATHISSSPAIPRTLSLFSGGGWLCNRYPERSRHTGLREAYNHAATWFSTVHRVVFWAPSISRHLRLALPMSTLIAMRANIEKHHLLRLTAEVRRLRSRCVASGCELSVAEAITVHDEFKDHITGMLAYHATEVAEHIGRYFFALYRFVRGLYVEHPTNNLDVMPYPSDISDDIFRYMYTSTVFQLSQWTEERIASSTPRIGPAFTKPYPQRDWGIVDSERGDG